METPDVRTPASRRADPESSHEAELRVTASGQRKTQQALVLDAVRKFPNSTSREVAVNAKLDRYMVGRRLSELEAGGFVERGALRRCTQGRGSAVTWHAVPVQPDLVGS